MPCSTSLERARDPLQDAVKKRGPSVRVRGSGPPKPKITSGDPEIFCGRINSTDFGTR